MIQMQRRYFQVTCLFCCFFLFLFYFVFPLYVVQMERYLVVVDTLVSKSTLGLLLIDTKAIHQQNTSVMLIRAIKLFKMFFVEYVPRLLNLFLFSGNPADWKFFFYPPPPPPPQTEKKIPQKGDTFFLKGFTAVFLTKIKNSFNVKNALKQCVILLNKLLAVKNN